MDETTATKTVRKASHSSNTAPETDQLLVSGTIEKDY
jgi:hypothetical protein